jgi:hypothetical protein
MPLRSFGKHPKAAQVAGIDPTLIPQADKVRDLVKVHVFRQVVTFPHSHAHAGRTKDRADSHESSLHNSMNLTKDPKTTICGVLCLLTVLALMTHQIDTKDCVTLLGLFVAGLGITSKDSSKE